jgi:hypothetical protein
MIPSVRSPARMKVRSAAAIDVIDIASLAFFESRPS